jgi:hypothetical protein
MKLSELKQHLLNINNLNFVLPGGKFVPRHFHITEIGLVTKNFIDCGGELHNEQTASMQIWVAQDIEHRLMPAKLLGIIDISKKVLADADPEVEVEYQTDTIGKYTLEFEGENFLLIPTHTDCLAKSTCGIPETKPELAGAEKAGGCCTPGGGCC